MELDFLDSFRFPFSPKPLRLVPLANRAVTLSAVTAVKLMAVSAMRFLRIDVAGRGRVSLRVVRGGYGIEMLRVDASAIPAYVIYDESVRNRAIGEEKRNAVSLSRCAAERDDSVSIPVFVSGPNQAVAFALDLGVKSLDLMRRWLQHCVPVGWLASTAYPVNIVKVSLCNGN